MNQSGGLKEAEGQVQGWCSKAPQGTSTLRQTKFRNKPHLADSQK